MIPTAAEAKRMIAGREGFTLDESTGCWIADERGPEGWGPYLPFFIARHGPIPPGLEVAHTCPNGREGCVRPSHLDLVPEGTPVERASLPPLQEPDALAFTRRIRDEREARKATLRDFASELRVSQYTLKNWERGESQPSADTARSIARRLGWDGKPRKFLVTFVGQNVVTEQSAGDAMRTVWNHLEHVDEGVKLAVYEVRPVR